MNGKKKTLPTRFEEGQPNFWLEVCWPGEQTAWGSRGTFVQCLELLERYSDDPLTFELHAIHKQKGIGRGVYRRRDMIEFDIIEESEAVQGLFALIVADYLKDRDGRLKALEKHPCSFQPCTLPATGNDVARVIVITDDRGDPHTLTYYGCEDHFNYIANASISVGLVHKAAYSSHTIQPTTLTPVQLEQSRVSLPKPTPLLTHETSQQRKRREQREAKLAAWLQEAFDQGKRRSSLFHHKQDAQRLFREASYDFQTVFLADARKKRIVTHETNVSKQWLQHYLEGVLGDNFGTLDSQHVELYDQLYPKIGRVKR